MEEKKTEVEKYRGVATSAASLKWEVERGSLYKLCTGRFLLGVCPLLIFGRLENLLYLSVFSIDLFHLKYID